MSVSEGMAPTTAALSTEVSATTEPSVLTTPVIVIISLGAYVFAVAVLLIIKEVLVSKGKCTQNVCPCCDCCGGQPAKKNDCLNSWCLQWAECCNCCGPPMAHQRWDQCCVRRKGGIDCYDVILCQCCNDCNVCADICCDPKTPLCNCQGCGGNNCGGCFQSCVCQCSKPECQKIDCCCCEIQLKGGQQMPPPGYPNGGYGGGYGGGGGDYGNDDFRGGGRYGGDGYGRGGNDYDDRQYYARGGREGSDRWENARYEGGGRTVTEDRGAARGRRERGLPQRDQPRGGNPFLASGYNDGAASRDVERGERGRLSGGGRRGERGDGRYEDSRF